MSDLGVLSGWFSFHTINMGGNNENFDAAC